MKHTVIFAATALVAMLAAGICAAQDPSRGVKREKEECEEFAFQAEANPRASASAVSRSEAVAYKMAMTEARAELAAQVAAEITGFVRRRVEQYRLTAGADTEFALNSANLRGSVSGSNNKPRTVSALIEADSSETVQRVVQVISNTRPVCKNTYDCGDGSVRVYVCVEMGLAAQRQVYKELKNDELIDFDLDSDGKNDIGFDEKEFLIELAKAREEYNRAKTGDGE
jgi:hypothetical protein